MTRTGSFFLAVVGVEIDECLGEELEEVLSSPMRWEMELARAMGGDANERVRPDEGFGVTRGVIGVIGMDVEPEVWVE